MYVGICNPYIIWENALVKYILARINRGGTYVGMYFLLSFPLIVNDTYRVIVSVGAVDAASLTYRF